MPSNQDIPLNSSQNFNDLELSPSILKAVFEQGYTKPSPIQAKAIPTILSGADVMGSAQTGTGKTAGFTLPILDRLSTGRSARSNQVRALVITPTRELAAQVGKSIEIYGKYLPLRSAVVFGGVNINPQMMRLRKGVDILVATPGRLLDLYNQNAVRFRHLEVLVLDEADRMLDMGFLPDIKRILALLPRKKQTLLFSATFSDDIRRLAKGLTTDPVEISVTPRNSTVKAIEQWVSPVDKKRKPALLTRLIKGNDWGQVLVFTRTKHGANKLTRHLQENGIKSAAIHGNKSQAARTKALHEFKLGSTQVLVATDIAARGLDINQLPHVVNFDLPSVPEDYVHRIGRTGRAGARGEAVSLVSADEASQLKEIERLIQRSIPRETIDGFEPNHDVPPSRITPLPLRKKKPKKQQNSSTQENRSSRTAQETSKNGNTRHADTNRARKNTNTSSQKDGNTKQTTSKSSFAGKRKPNRNAARRTSHS